jgi:hypothetical protein
MYTSTQPDPFSTLPWAVCSKVYVEVFIDLVAEF